MALTVETGSIVSGADCYADKAAFDAWCVNHYGAARTEDVAVVEAAIRRSVRYLDNMPWKGLTSEGRGQALEWPRQGVVDEEGHSIASDEIPREVIFAQHRLAYAELEESGVLDAVFTPGTSVKREKIGEIEVEYSAPANTREAARATVAMAMDAIDGLLLRSPNTGSGGISGGTVRA